jgi:hypothetical protein
MNEYFTTIQLQITETYEDFVYETILPYCQDVTQLKLNKEELKRLLLLGIQKDKELKEQCLAYADQDTMMPAT